MIIGAVAIALIGVGCYVTGWMHGRGILDVDNGAGCQHCVCDCELDCQRCAEVTAEEIMTGKPAS